MPEILINGERKKVACGPCIRGHRSSKCQHHDRVLIEVRKPGRPLSSCPHPAGSCGCERITVSYTVPTNALQHSCPAPFAAAVAVPAAPSIRVQKSKNRKSLSNITPSTVEKALKDESPWNVETPGTLKQGAQSCCNTKRTSADITPNNASRDSSGSSSPTTKDEDTNNEEQEPRLRLGMMGVGGYGASRDEIGWDGDWPDPWKSEAAEQQEQFIQQSSFVHASNDAAGKSLAQRSCCSTAKSAPTFTPSDQAGHQQRTPSDAQINIQGLAIDQASVTQPGYPFSNGQSMLPSQFQPRYDSLGGFAAPPYPAVGKDTNGSIPMLYQQHNPPQNFAMVHPFANGESQNCSCGDDCACFACAVHPTNTTTKEYVRRHYDYISRLSRDHSAQNSHLTTPHEQLSQAPLDWQFTQVQMAQMSVRQAPGLQNMPYPPPINTQFMASPHSSTPYTPNGNGNGNGNVPWQMGPTGMADVPAPPNALDASNMQTAPNHDAATNSMNDHLNNGLSFMPINVGGGIQFNQPFLTDNSADQGQSTNDDSILSPTSFLLNQFVLSGCSDATGTCQCGDGCICEGCLTHGGHNGVLIDGAHNAAQHNHMNASSNGMQQDMDGFGPLLGEDSLDSLRLEGDVMRANHA